MADASNRAGPSQGHRYRICGSEEPDRVEICFTGTFEGAPVQWHAVIVTLRRVWRERPPPQRGAAPRPFLHVREVSAGRGRIDVGLDVERIDPPTMLKTVIMVRRYKRLRRGLQEFGEPLRLPRPGP